MVGKIFNVAVNKFSLCFKLNEIINLKNSLRNSDGHLK